MHAGGGQQPSRRVPAMTRASFLVAACVAIAPAAVDSASAGTYVMRSCNVPGAAPASSAPWRWNAVGRMSAHDECASGGGFGVNGSPAMAPYDSGEVFVTTGPEVTIRRVRLFMLANLSTGSGRLAVAVSAGSQTNSVSIAGSPGADWIAAPYVSELLPVGTTVYHVYASCVDDAGVGCTPSSRTLLDIRGAEVTLEENVAPTGTIEGGDLLAGGPQAGARALGYTANDLESGVARVSAVVGTTVVGTADFAAECAFTGIAACPQARRGSIAVDTHRIADGLYAVSLRVTDAAGNEQTVHSPSAIQVVNGSAEGTAPLRDARLSASFAANHQETLMVGYGGRVLVRGNLRSRDGDPIAGATVEVTERPTAGGGRNSLGRVTTGRDGIFRYTVTRGASRTLSFAFAGATTAARLRLRVRAAATLDVRLAGIVVRYRGRVLSEPLPSKGKLVEIQGRAPGAGWTTFARRRTTGRGDFSGTYRLRVHRPGVRLQFRVRVPAQTGYPFLARTGRAVTRTVA